MEIQKFKVDNGIVYCVIDGELYGYYTTTHAWHKFGLPEKESNTEEVVPPPPKPFI